ncbi:hypothetical protein [Nonomuraea jabiensis]|uniref:hypothetical protein n=1 Tax=Nonomuraea jabiensis TaxID=882448 RepID=UPI0036C36A83
MELARPLVADQLPHRDAVRPRELEQRADGRLAFPLLVPWLPGVFAELSTDGPGGFALPLDPAALGVDDPGDADWLRTRSAPMPVRTHSEPLPDRGRPEGVPAMFVRCLRFEAFAGTAAAFRSLGRPVAELDCHHYAQVTHPAELADLLLTARTETIA